LVAAGDDDGGAVLGKGPRGGLADAAGTTGNDDDA